MTGDIFVAGTSLHIRAAHLQWAPEYEGIFGGVAVNVLWPPSSDLCFTFWQFPLLIEEMEAQEDLQYRYNPAAALQTVRRGGGRFTSDPV